MKRYAIVEIPDEVKYLSVQVSAGQKLITPFPEVLNGRVELMKKACELAGVQCQVPKKGEWFYSLNHEGQWEKCKYDYGPGEVRTVIPNDNVPQEEYYENIHGH
uniref:Uncharacterized protein n=1 Tax=viral metagenome TaxID=1070528 RepID=A0A6M3IJU3_9ZZZZ